MSYERREIFNCPFVIGNLYEIQKTNWTKSLSGLKPGIILFIINIEDISASSGTHEYKIEYLATSSSNVDCIYYNKHVFFYKNLDRLCKKLI